VLPEASFYVLASHSSQQRQEFACKLIEKIYRSGQFCYLLVDDPAQADMLDKLLWTFRAGSFIPHQCYQGITPAYQNTVLIGENDIPLQWRKVIINLSDQLPPLDPPTERILEILDASEQCRQAARQRYRHYQQLGLNITTHKL